MKISHFTDNTIKYIIFDLDGVLVDSFSITKKAAKTALFEIGIDAQDIDFSIYQGTGEKNFITGPCEALGKSQLSAHAINRFYEIFEELSRKELHCFKSAKPLILNLRQRNICLAIASSSALKKVKASLSGAGLLEDWFDVIVSGDEVTLKKPSPEIYMTAIKKLGTDSQSCLVIEDAISGITAAKGANLRVFSVTTSFEKSRLLDAGADFVGDDILEVLDIL